MNARSCLPRLILFVQTPRGVQGVCLFLSVCKCLRCPSAPVTGQTKQDAGPRDVFYRPADPRVFFMNDSAVHMFNNFNSSTESHATSAFKWSRSVHLVHSEHTLISDLSVLCSVTSKVNGPP